MKVAVLADQLPPEGNGGVASAQHNLFKIFETLGWETRGFSYGDLRPGPAPAGVVRKRFPRWAFRLAKKIFLELFEIHSVLVLKKFPVGYVSEFPVALFGALNGLRMVPALLRFSPDVIVVPDRGAPAAFWPGSLKRKSVVISHSNPMRFLDNPLIGRYSELDARMAVALEQRMFGACRAVVCPSQCMEVHFRKTYRFDGPVRVIPNLIDQELLRRIAPRSFHPGQKKPGALTVFIPAASNSNKGRQFTFEIVRRLAARRRGDLFFFLSGSINEELAAFLKQAPANAKLFSPGSLPYAENLAYMKACQLCVSPTLIESFGMSLLEAQAAGIPVVTFDVDGTAEVVEQGRTGVLVPFLDVESLIAESRRLLEDRGLRTRLGKAATLRTRRIFSAAATRRHYQELFDATGAS